MIRGRSHSGPRAPRPAPSLAVASRARIRPRGRGDPGTGPARLGLGAIRLGAIGLAAIGLVLAPGCDISRPTRSRPDGSTGCPRVFGEGERVWVDSTCFLTRCQARASQDGCSARITLEGCAPLVVEVTIDAKGGATFAPSPELGTCTSSEPKPESLLASSCDGLSAPCRFDVYATTASFAAGLEQLRILDVPFEAPNPESVELLDARDPLRGYLGGATLLPGGEELAVSTYDGRYSGLDCGGTSTSRMVFVDAVELRITRSATTVPCLGKLAPDPLGAGVIATFGGRDPHLGRFSATGELLQSSPLVLPDDGVERYISALVPLEDGGLRVIATARRDPYSAYAAAIDPGSLATTRVSPRIDGDLRSGALVRARYLLAGDRFNGRVLTFGAEDLEPGPSFALLHELRHSDDAGFGAFDAVTGRLIVSTTGRSGVTWVAMENLEGGAPLVGFALAYARTSVAWASLRVPGGPFLLGLTGSGPDHVASLVRFEPERVRFVPGELTLGQGAVSELILEPRGRVFAVLPWSAVLARVDLAAR